ncbi:MAG: thioredoxin domain-containing protein [Terriglobales bacterium]
MEIQPCMPRFVFLSVLTLALAFSPAASWAVSADDVPQALRPPNGAQTALVVFEDLECPVCGQTAPLLQEASRVYRIPLVQYDFPLPQHNWSFDAAVIARYFDTYSKELGNQFRLAIFAQQREIVSPIAMRAFAERFASEHKLSLPFAVEKTPKLVALVNGDKDIGTSLHVIHTPTIYIVSSKKNKKAFIEVTDTSQLYVMIDAMK